MAHDKKTSTAPENAGIDFGLLPSLIGYQLRLAQIAIFRDFAKTLGEHEVTPGLFGVLIVIESNPGLKQTELANATHLDRSTMVSVIDKLEARGLVSRKQAAGDRRSNALQLTAEGTALLKKLKRLVADHEKRLARHLSESDQATLTRLLQKIFHEHR